jgi:hypothetical protein
MIDTSHAFFNAYIRIADMVMESQIAQRSAAPAVAVGTVARATELRGFISTGPGGPAVVELRLVQLDLPEFTGVVEQGFAIRGR